MTDPKELKIPNICFSLDEGNEKDSEKYKKQRIERGFDDTETYNLFTTIAQFVLPRLKRFKEVNDSYPNKMTFEEWDEILDKMIQSFELITQDNFDIQRDDEKIKEGLDLFGKHFTKLWW